jgi:hypothetical protein
MILFLKNSIIPNVYFVYLSAPDFVSSTEDEDYVYFFFREAAVEYINCGKVSFKFFLCNYKLWKDEYYYIY